MKHHSKQLDLHPLDTAMFYVPSPFITIRSKMVEDNDFFFLPIIPRSKMHMYKVLYIDFTFLPWYVACPSSLNTCVRA